jgi:amino acid transporter
VPVPAGETVDPRRSVGLAMAVSVVGATLLYALVQFVAAGTLPTLGASERPLVDAARAFAGPAGGAAIAVVATLSALGFCSSSAMVVPRYVETFAQDAFLPTMFARRSARFDTPVTSIVATSLFVVVLSVSLDFTALADVSNVAVVVQYQSTSIAILLWRFRDPRPSAFRLPLGPVIPVVAIAGTVFFLLQVSRGELLFGAALLGGGLAFGVANRLWRRVAMK